MGWLDYFWNFCTLKVKQLSAIGLNVFDLFYELVWYSPMLQCKAVKWAIPVLGVKDAKTIPATHQAHLPSIGVLGSGLLANTTSTYSNWSLSSDALRPEGQKNKDYLKLKFPFIYLQSWIFF